MRALTVRNAEHILRDCIGPEELGDRRLHVDERDGELALGITWGEPGPKMGYKYRRVPLERLSIRNYEAGELIAELVREVRWLLSESRRGHGLVVGVAGKWRKFGRAA